MPLLPCLSIRQPWATLIIGEGKDIENRSWNTRYRGPLVIHAALGATKAEFDEALAFVDSVFPLKRIEDRLSRYVRCSSPRGGIIGTVDLVDCVTESDSPWFFGPYGFVLANPRPCKFVPMKGRLGLFNIAANLIERAA